MRSVLRPGAGSEFVMERIHDARLCEKMTSHVGNEFSMRLRCIKTSCFIGQLQLVFSTLLTFSNTRYQRCCTLKCDDAWSIDHGILVHAPTRLFHLFSKRLLKKKNTHC